MSWDRQLKAELRGDGHSGASREVASLLKTAIRLNSTHYQCLRQVSDGELGVTRPIPE